DLADFCYKCSDYYHPQDERTLLWNDPVLKIEWPDVEPRILSEKDKRGVTLENAEVYS
ncbi:MAG: dTDP-4-keto-6-deoxy-D-glucose epimerase, partial [Planctomycetes bacterium]|nr:dTDP-4-keto-6-deoxy-D-glucose epimerase [Planctomycetota bacterium]